MSILFLSYMCVRRKLRTRRDKQQVNIYERLLHHRMHRPRQTCYIAHRRMFSLCVCLRCFRRALLGVSQQSLRLRDTVSHEEKTHGSLDFGLLAHVYSDAVSSTSNHKGSAALPTTFRMPTHDLQVPVGAFQRQTGDFVTSELF